MYHIDGFQGAGGPQLGPPENARHSGVVVSGVTLFSRYKLLIQGGVNKPLPPPFIQGGVNKPLPQGWQKPWFFS